MQTLPSRPGQYPARGAIVYDVHDMSLQGVVGMGDTLPDPLPVVLWVTLLRLIARDLVPQPDLLAVVVVVHVQGRTPGVEPRGRLGERLVVLRLVPVRPLFGVADGGVALLRVEDLLPGHPRPDGKCGQTEHLRRNWDVLLDRVGGLLRLLGLHLLGLHLPSLHGRVGRLLSRDKLASATRGLLQARVGIRCHVARSTRHAMPYLVRTRVRSGISVVPCGGTSPPARGIAPIGDLSERVDGCDIVHGSHQSARADELPS
ncbi:hypothetical protein L226DRAFT_397437 [Lentinus tigrinus ALCF2SS1-7]|uniref:uncharacterized protein n=1 Tax=Lentinus tigrinus ALCF2SS1-7 TaxID=1328758 RepID=UPI001165DD4D|nr:hypothetical protein L226DRAFT_397437 [Lentinus tigrinus ALCF2SS1-7]